METAMGPHYELTDKTMEWEGRTLYRIRATRDLKTLGVRKGHLGGWVESPYNLRDNAWAFENSKVWGNARLVDNSAVFDEAQVFGFAVMSGNSRAYDNSKIFEDAVLSGNGRMECNSQAFGDCRIQGVLDDDAQVSGNAHVGPRIWITGNAEISERQHILTLDPIGSESVQVILYRTTTGHKFQVGCWAGTVDGLMDEVERRRNDSFRWAHYDDADRWTAEYAALKALCEIRIASWHSIDDKPAD